VTEAQITLLRSLAEADVVTFIPEGNTAAAALARFEATLARLRDLLKAGWVELEVAEEQKRRRGRHRQTKHAAAARSRAGIRCGSWGRSDETPDRRGLGPGPQDVWAGVLTTRA
jgi:hypothetical protein